MRTRALKVLLVEDNAGDARLLPEMFTTERPGSIELTLLMRMSAALVHLAKAGVDIVLLDMGLPDGHGLDTVRAVAPDVPLIVLTGLDDEALAAEAMKEGAQDYLIKGQIENRALRVLCAIYRRAARYVAGRPLSVRRRVKPSSARDLWCMTWAGCNIAGIRSIISSGVVVDDAYGALQIITALRRCAPDLYRTSFLPFQGW